MEHPSHLLKQLQHGHARKRFGQHFLASEGVLRKIVAGAGVESGDRVVEIGPGLGGLTECLLEAGCEVLAVELDRDLAAFLRERLGDRPGFSLVEQDATTVDWAEMLPGEDWACVANLPYNVGTTLVTQMLRHPGRLKRLVVMLQKEVAERMVAAAGDRKRGSLSVYCQSRASVRLLMKVPPGAFMPPPKVESAVIVLDILPEPVTGGVDADALEAFVKLGFSFPRKTLGRTLGSRYGRLAVLAALASLELPEKSRAAELDVETWCRLALAMGIR
jgi:16S rRNA (adenine1518-N6/adenine1519-N6)-dimethyltransferase